MLDPSTETRAAEPLRRAVTVVVITSIAGFILYTAWLAVFSAFANDDFPESLAVKVELMPLLFPVHMVSGGLALILLPLTIALRRRRPWHRWIGRIAATDVLISGLTAFPVAWVAPVTIWSAAGFSAQATTWLVLLALGIHNIRRRQIAAHRTCMLLMTATAFGAMVFRVLLASWALFGTTRSFETFYIVDSWIAWLLPLGATALVLRWRQSSRYRFEMRSTAVPSLSGMPTATE